MDKRQSSDNRGGNRRPGREAYKGSGAGKPYDKKKGYQGKSRDDQNDNNSSRPRRPYGEGRSDGSGSYDRPANKGFSKNYGEKSNQRPPWKSRDTDDSPGRPYRSSEGEQRPPWKKRDDNESRPYKPYSERGDQKPSWKSRGDKEGNSGKPYGDKGGSRPPWKKREERDGQGSRPPWKKREERDGQGSRPYGENRYQKPSWKSRSDNTSKSVQSIKYSSDGLIRLNKFIANSGVCSRREADMLITAGTVTVNGQIVTTLGTKVSKNDTIVYEGQKLTAEKKVYVLLNKPKDFITTLDDPQGRKTVMDLVKGAGDARLYPVGRLDRNTTGLLLMTNDGEITKKLTHPKHGVKKLYHVVLDKPLTKSDMQAISEGVVIEGEKIIPDDIAYSKSGEDKTQLGIEIHSGQNRVVRRIFESLDYKVEKLDRVLFAGLSKRDLPRGHWRFLTEKEINFLKML